MSPPSAVKIIFLKSLLYVEKLQEKSIFIGMGKANPEISLFHPKRLMQFPHEWIYVDKFIFFHKKI